MMDAEKRKMIEAKAESHKWSIDCTCDTDPYGNCWYHLDDTEKAKDSFLKGAAAMEEIMREREAKLVAALEETRSSLISEYGIRVYAANFRFIDEAIDEHHAAKEEDRG